MQKQHIPSYFQMNMICKSMLNCEKNKLEPYWRNWAVQHENPLLQVLKALLLDHMPSRNSLYTHLI